MRIRLLVSGLLLCGLAPATLVAPPNLARAVEQADVIVVAAVRQGTVRAAGSRVASDLLLRVERVLKGSAVPGTELSAALEGRGMFVIEPARVSQAPSLRGIWFLREAEGRYTVIPRAADMGEPWMAPVVLPEGVPAPAPGATPAESVGNELVAALRHSSTFELEQSLRSLGDAITRPIYRQLAGETSPRLRAIGIAGLVQSNDPEGPQRAAAELKALAGATDVHAIAQALMEYSNDKDPEAVRALAGLAAQDLAVANVSCALRALHTREAMPALIALLDSTDSAVRANALAGVCLFVRNAPTVTPDAVRTMAWMQAREPAPFRNAETDRYCWMGGMPEEAARLTGHVIFWKAWWQEHGWQ